QPAVPLRVDEKVDARIRALLPFSFTPAQERVLKVIRKDLAATRPMNRLLQGDVGSGKTVVALYAMLCAAATKNTSISEPRPLGSDPGTGSSLLGSLPNGRGSDGLTASASPGNSAFSIQHSALFPPPAPNTEGSPGPPVFVGHQAALMAPTEVLAEQHYLTLTKLLEGKRVKIGLLVGGQPAAERADILRGLADGSLHLVVGTHALLTDGVNFQSLAVVVIDEQHKFGVAQRSLLRGKVSGHGGTPHTLVMTATPIPRTLAMTAFGDLDVSVIDELPPGRVPIHTQMTPSANRQEVYAFVAQHLKAGEQAYVVLPTIDEGELDLRSATTVHDELQADWLKDYRVGLIHGRMPRDQRPHVMERVRQHLVDVLVSTTVIEVGVDVPNATIMVIEHADRFGLSQLHQLRGRVGRSNQKSYCLLLADLATEDGEKRMQAMVKFTSGFKIAEEDLKLRGMGQLIGTAQSGRTDMAFADLLFDPILLTLARRDAFTLIAADPRLLDPTHAPLRRELLDTFGASISLADVG
ncbi:MAG: ATP-dependent DNA helicase RecG, partial [Phycisphaerae bacterium]